MTTVVQLKKNRNLLNSIDWTTTPEEGMDMFSEWDAGWTSGIDMVNSNITGSIYFVFHDPKTPFQATLIRRTVKEAVEITKISMPNHLFHTAYDKNSRRRGETKSGINALLINWLSAQIDDAGLEPTLTLH